MRNLSSLKKLLILVAILALPGFLYYLLQEKGKNRYRPLSIYGPKQVASTFHSKRGKKIPDTIYHRIGNFKLRNTAGDSVSIPAGKNQIAIVNFFFTQCKTACKDMNIAMSRVASVYSGNKMVKFYSISVDPLRDTPEVLKNYAKSVGADSTTWTFLTGNRESVYSIGKDDFLLDVLAPKHKTGDIIHSQMLVLVDSDKKIRGYYDSSSKEQVEKLMDEIKVQITEELRNNPSLMSSKND